jgi:hypothetical protein
MLADGGKGDRLLRLPAVPRLCSAVTFAFAALRKKRDAVEFKERLGYVAAIVAMQQGCDFMGVYVIS